MKIVPSSHFKESQIRPEILFEKWKKILEQDANHFFFEKGLVSVNCPGCGNKNYKFAFKKMGFKYQHCQYCNTLFVSPRPTEKMIDDFFEKARCVKFWKNKMVKVSGTARRRYLTTPLYNWAQELIKNYQPEAKSIFDYKPRYFSLFSLDKNFGKKFENIYFFRPVVLAGHPFPKNVKIEKDFKKIKGKVDVFLAFDDLDREFDPQKIIKRAAKICRSGALLFITTNTYSGFEYQILGENSSRLVIPDRLNLLSIESLRDILNKAGFEILELSTPGELDVEIAAKALMKNSNIRMPDFFKYIFKYRDEEVKEALQNFLQLNNLSSFLRIAAIKK